MSARSRHPELRIWRSPQSVFYRDETSTAASVYTAAELRRLVASGFNAIWISAILRDVVPTSVFPECGADSPRHLRALRTVIRRAAREGVRVFLLMQPPRGRPQDDPFWGTHPALRGTTWGEGVFRSGPMSALCTSSPRVTDFIQEAARTLSCRLPGLAGAILITASEYMSHCYSHYALNPEAAELAGSPPGPLPCPRCRTRSPADVVTEIVTCVRDGFRAADNGAEVIAWNWSWSFYEKEPQAGIVRALPRGIRFMAGFERGGHKTILGKRRLIDEYAIGYTGPSARFRGAVAAARQRGLPVLARLQLGTTHELATVPNLPVIPSLYEKVRALRQLRIRSFVGCWNFGNMLTLNTYAFTYFLSLRRLPPRSAALRGLARDYFPGSDARGVVAAWELFARAMDAYPFGVAFLYYGPLNYAVAHPIAPGPAGTKPVGGSWVDVADRGDDLRQSLGDYSLDDVIQGLARLTRTWWDGVTHFETATQGLTDTRVLEERNTARMAAHCFHSGWNLYRAYRLRRTWRNEHLPALSRIMQDEVNHLGDAADLAAADPRLGLHIEPHCALFDAARIRQKAERLRAYISDARTSAASPSPPG